MILIGDTRFLYIHCVPAHRLAQKTSNAVHKDTQNHTVYRRTALPFGLLRNTLFKMKERNKSQWGMA